MYRDDPDYFCRGNSTHQYLTATEMPGQSERLVDLALGRPTRTSLLRVRQRTKSAPGVRAIVEVKTHLHKQQQLAAKTEERYKSVDIPQDLLPVTEGDETVRQFLIGARYNRQDPLHCFKMNVPVKDNLPSNVAHLRGSVSFLNLTESCESFGSESNLSELAASNRDPPCPKSAWSTLGQDDRLVASKGALHGTGTPAPSPSPANRSQETFLSKRGSGWRKRPKLKIIDGKSLKQDGGQECCIMCKSEEFPRQYQRFAPGSHFMRVKDAGKEEEDGDWHQNKDHMLVQQYHLRIMGIKYGVTSGPQAPPPPRSNLLYTTKKSGNTTELPFIKQARNVRTNNRNNSGDDSPTNKPRDAIPDRPSSNSSKISVRISTHSDVDEDAQSTPQEDTPRADVAHGYCAKEDNNNQVGNAVTNGETVQVESSKEGMDTHRSNEASEEIAQAVVDDAQDEGDTSVDKDTGQDEPSGAVSANNAEQEDDERHGEDIAEQGISKDHPGGETQDTGRDDVEDDTPKESSDLKGDARDDSTDVFSKEVQDVQQTNDDVAREDIHNDQPVHDGLKELAESTEIQNPTDSGKDCEAINGTDQ
ncbi:uncharacterized protein LOC119724348 isoform X2 [Patiria miniata]|nr:uncharacterized protein LOC119724348 isoform X2 [Patiria miniata]